MDRQKLAVLSLLLIPFMTQTADAGAIGTKRGKVFHTQGDRCASARKIGQDNRVQFASAEEAKRAGRRLCKRCASLAQRSAQPTGEDTGPSRPPGRMPAADQPAAKPSAKKVPEPVSLPEFARVTKVLSGGTLVLDNGEKAVLLGVSCPQRGQPNAKRVTRFLSEQTRGRTLRLTYETSACRMGRRDSLGRLAVYMVAEPNGRDLGAELIFQGYGWLDRGANFERRGEYIRLEEGAWRDGRGVWERNKGTSGDREVVTGRHARSYHAPNCKHVKHLTGEMNLTLNEARARRLVPCALFRSK